MRYWIALILSATLLLSPVCVFGQASDTDGYGRRHYDGHSNASASDQPAPIRFSFPDPGSEKDCFFQGIVDGRRIARMVHSVDGSDWAGHAALGQFVAGSDGGTLAYAMASTSRDLPPEPVLAKLNPLTMQYQQGFLQGYDQQMHQMNKEDASYGLVIGALLTLGVGVAVLIGARHK